MMGRKPPKKPNPELSHEHDALWTFMLHLNSRIDGLTWLLVGGTSALFAAILGVLAAVLLK